MTVSRALNHPERVSPVTLAKVMEAVRTTGFVPNAMAVGLRSSRAKLVAALLPTLVGPVFQETVKSLSATLELHGYQLMIGETGYGRSNEDALLDAVIRRRPDGIVLTGVMHSSAGRNRLAASGIPVVETWDLTASPIDMLVGFSHEEIGAQVRRYLHDHRHVKVALISADDDRARRRAEGFRKAGALLGLRGEVPMVFMPAPSTLGAGRAGLRRLLRDHAVTAVFCSSDTLALGAMIEAQAMNLRVPQDLAIVGFGDQEFAKDLEPPLTTVRVDGTQIGKIAAELVVERVEKRPSGRTIVDIGFSVVQRSSG